MAKSQTNTTLEPFYTSFPMASRPPGYSPKPFNQSAAKSGDSQGEYANLMVSFVSSKPCRGSPLSSHSLQAEVQGLRGQWPQGSSASVSQALFTWEPPYGSLSSQTKVGLALFILKVSVQHTSALGSPAQYQAGFWMLLELPEHLYWNLLVSCQHFPTRK